MTTNNATRRAFIIGHPVAHSRSPKLHGHWLAQYGISGSYEPVDVTPDRLPEFIARLRTGEFVGGNATIPLKEHLAPLCDEIDDAATAIGAINTLALKGGKLFATNTDCAGFLGNLDQDAPGWDKDKDHALVLGAGGASRAILYGLIQRGFKRISLLNRTVERAEALAREFGAIIDPGALEDFAQRAGDATLLVNTSAIGMHGSRFEGLDLNLLPETALVTDIVYTPLVTPLLADAKARGLRIVDGLGMLLHQAVPGFELWFGIRPKVTPELRALIEADLAE